MIFIYKLLLSRQRIEGPSIEHKIVSLTSGLPMVRQSLQNGRAGLPHYLPPSPKAGKPKGREAERPGSRKGRKGRKGRNADWAEVRPNLVCVTLSYR